MNAQNTVFLAFKDIINHYFSATSTYNVIDTSQLVIDAERNFVFVTDFDRDIPETPKTEMPKNGIIGQIPIKPTEYLNVFFVPRRSVYLQLHSAREEVEGNDTVYRVQNYNIYYCQFDLVFYSKFTTSIRDTKAFIFKDLFFNTFRGNVDIDQFLTPRKIWNFTFENREVLEIPTVQDVMNVARYQTSHTCRVWQKTNSFLVDKVKKIKIEEIKFIS